jgi:hypothetical protein
VLSQWKEHTTVERRSSDDIIIWFWEVLKEGTPEFRSQILWFQTGSARCPPAGFASMRCKIKFLRREGGLPQAHTCFNEIDLPRCECTHYATMRFASVLVYTSVHELTFSSLLPLDSSKEEARNMLQWAAASQGSGFAFA